MRSHGETLPSVCSPLHLWCPEAVTPTHQDDRQASAETTPSRGREHLSPLVDPWTENMAQTSLLQGKRFYCREWVFHKIQHCLQEKSNSPGITEAPVGGPSSGAGKGGSWGVLLVGGPGSGKTALCTELLWPTSVSGVHRGLHQHCLAFHFCRAEDSDTLCVSGFIRALVSQICRSELVPGYEEKVREPAFQSALQPGECERNPAESFKR